VPQIEVSFEVDANGIVSVSARDKATGREQAMRITPTSGLAPEEIDRLLREAEELADSDRSAKETVLMRNKLESLLRNTKKSFVKFGGMMTQEQQDNAEKVFADVDEAAQSDQMDEMKKAMATLESVAMQLTSAMLGASDATTSEV
jgi:molecular chaperone DnaK